MRELSWKSSAVPWCPLVLAPSIALPHHVQARAEGGEVYHPRTHAYPNTHAQHGHACVACLRVEG
eukprot:scaffold55969_cov78-Phaeocystis_antarctica.AAC.1